MDCKNISTYRSEIYGFSILWIMLFHAKAILKLSYCWTFGFLKPLDTLIGYGNMGCELFMICSGISLWISFDRNPDLACYLKRRFEKLLIPVLIIDGWYWIWLHLIRAREIPVFLNKITLIRFWLTGDQQIWFVSAIMVFYLLFPFVFAVIGKGKGRGGRAALLIAFALMLIWSAAYGGAEYYKLTEIGLTRLPVFIFGVWLGKTVLEGKRIPAGAVVFAAAFAFVCFMILESRQLHGYWRRIFYALPAICLLVCLGWLFRMLGKNRLLMKGLSFCGAISLNLYLSHILVIRLYRLTPFYEHKRLMHYGILIVISVFIAWGSDRAEKLLRRILRRKSAA